MSTGMTVRVNRKAADRVHSGHPWIFSSDVLDRGEAQPGAVVRVIDHAGKLLGTAHYSSTSQIALRLLSRRVETIDSAFLRDRINAALQFRTRVVSDSDSYRLIHAEADLLPGLIVDRYGEYLSVQLLNQGMDRLTPEIVDALRDVVSPLGIVARNDAPMRSKENLPLDVTILHGDIPPHVPMHFNGLVFEADLVKGQKTGVFLDQRENYLAVRRWARGKVLDCFTGSGGFAVHAASGCDSVDAIDSSDASIASAKSNAARNNLSNIEFRTANVLDLLPNLVSARRTYNLVIVDPPAFAKSRSAMEGAARGYKEINLRALRLLGPGGILVTCSCSHHMSEAHLLEVVAAAALDVGKQLRVLERRTQAQDHPILLTVPETHYLKCLILQVV